MDELKHKDNTSVNNMTSLIQTVWLVVIIIHQWLVLDIQQYLSYSAIGSAVNKLVEIKGHSALLACIK